MTQAESSSTADDLTSRFMTVQARLRSAAEQFGRPADAVNLLAVSKRHSSGAIRTLHGCGQRAFGENYVDEALTKMAELDDLPIEWHYIGPIQSNKTRLLAEHFSWVQSVDRPKLLRRLGTQRPTGLPPLNILLQVRIGSEETKAGVTPAELGALADLAEEFPALRLRGLMCIPPPETDSDRQRAWFQELRELHELHDGPGRGWDTLSMGMSADLEAAIAEGATMVRIGTDIFGPRA